MSDKRLNLIFFLILAAALTLISISFKDITFAVKADEGLYYNYSVRVAEHGLKGFNGLFNDYFSDPSHKITQNPLRVGFIIIGSLLMKLFGYSIYNLAFLSLFSYLFFLALVFYFAKKYLDKDLVLLFIILVAFSPLNMAMARRALTDSTANLFMFASILLFFENLQAKNKLRDLLFVLVYSFTILIREGSVLAAPFFLLYIFATRKNNPEYSGLRGLLVSTILPFSIAGTLYVILAGGFGQFYRAMISVVTSININDYAIFFCSGPWFRYLLDFMLLSPWVIICAIGFVFSYLKRKDKKEVFNYLLLFSLAMLFCYSFLIKNVRYLMIIDLPIRLFALLMLYELLQEITRQKTLLYLTLIIIAIAVFDYLRFKYYFVNLGIYDPVSVWFLQASHIIPWK